MKHELHQVGIIGCDPGLWAAKLAVIDQFDLRPFMVRPRIAQIPDPETTALTGVVAWSNDDDDDDDETDIWGDPMPKMQLINGIAHIPIQGMVAIGCPSFFKKFGIVDLDDVAKDVEAAVSDAGCRALVFDVNSPGGTLQALPEFASMIYSLASTGPKKIAARISGLGCSAAYYAIAGCNLISCAPSSQSVNIGVYQAILNSTKAFEAFGYKMEIYKSGAYKAAGYPGTDLSDAQKAEIQGKVDEIGAMFRDHVKAARPSAAESNMQGQSFLGSKAVALGFADDDAPSMSAFVSRFEEYLK